MIRLSLACAMVIAMACAAASANEPPHQTLIVFYDSTDTGPNAQLKSQYMPKLFELAGELNVGIVPIDIAAKGAPPQVTITPLIAFQNWRGRSIYQGRYTTVDRMKNFVRTARLMPQGKDPLVLRDIPVVSLGAAKVGSPIKITALSGSVPADHDQVAFEKAFRQAMARGFAKYRFEQTAQFGRADRLFYMDFHPYRGAGGKFFVSTALFSQFHCHEPVYVSKSPAQGTWDQREKVIAQAAASLEAQVIRQINESQIGDGFEVVGKNIAQKSWEQLGLGLPAKPRRSVNEPIDQIELGRKWQMDVDAQKNTPVVQFAFASPLDNYTGEVKQLDGTVVLGDGLTLADARGRFNAKVATLTMGEDELDAHIHEGLLDVDTHPTASFTFEKIESPQARLTFGQVIPAALVGQFTLMGKTIDLTAPASVEAYIGEDGQPRLSITATWVLKIDKPWKLEGPSGPQDARNVMNFRANIVLKPGVRSIKR